MNNLVSRNILQASGKLGDAGQFWGNKLTGTYHPLDFPTRRSAQTLSNEEAAEMTLQFPSVVSDRMLQISNGSDQRLFTVLMAGFGFVLHKYTGHDDIYIGIPVMKQEAGKEYLNLVLPICLRMSNAYTLRTLLSHTQQQLSEAIKHQNYDVLALIDQIYGEGRTKCTRFFEATCLFQSLHDPAYFQFIESELRFSFRKDGQSLYVDIRFNNQKYQMAMIKRFCKHVFASYTQMMTNPDMSLSEIELVSNEEFRSLTNFNDNVVPFPSEQPYSRLFEQQAHRSPECIAVADRTRTLNYRELNERANQLARYLLDQGFKPGEKLGLYMNRSTDTLTAIIAIFKVRGAYVPIDPGFPLQRIDYIVKKSEISGVISNAFDEDNKLLLCEALDSLQYKFCFGIDDLKLQNYSVANLELAGCGADLAYIIFTSGTTGQPKGAMVHHRGMINHIFSKIDALHLHPHDIVAQTASLCFDISVWQYLAVLLVGGSVRIIDIDIVMDVESLLRTLLESGTTIVEAVPSLLRELLNYVDTRAQESRALPALRWMMVTGEALPVTLVNRWFNHYQIPLINAYGPTEVSDDITHHFIYQPAEANTSAIPIGRPIQNTAIYVLDSALKMCPIGVKGEICVAGPGVGYGYYGDKERTSKSFVPNPYDKLHDDLHYKVMYRTGDLGGVNEEGYLEYFGRLDDQIKIRGYRIELGEIECALESYPSIREAVVAVFQHDNGEQYLCCYLKSDQELSRNEIRQYLLDQLPEYMVPSYMVQLTTFPLNTNGKLDRFALPTPQRKDIAVGAKSVTPLTRTEWALTEIWGKVLGLQPDQIGNKDHFFSLGGHSLKLNQLQLEIAHRFGVDVTVGELFHNPTIEALGRLVEQGEHGRVVLEKAPNHTYYPVVPAQEKMFVRQQLNPEDTSFHISGVRIINGALDCDRLQSAFQKLIERHEAFRTSFAFKEDKVVQRIAPSATFEIERLYADEHQLDDAIQEFIRPFDLAQCPLLRVGLIELSKERHVLLIDIHHIVADGLSMNILIGDLARLYQGENLPALSVQHKDYCVWQNQQLQSYAFQEQLTYWSELFRSPAPELAIPCDYQCTEKLAYRAATVDFTLDPERSRRLEELVAGQSTTLFVALLSVYYLLLHKYSGNSDIVIGAPVSVRKFSELQHVIGMFINTLPIRNHVPENKAFNFYLADVGKQVISALEMVDLPVEQLPSEQPASNSGMFNAMFVFHDDRSPEAAVEIGGMHCSSYLLQAQKTKVDWHLESYLSDGCLKFRLDYNSDRYKRETTVQMTEDYLALIIQVLNDRYAKLSELHLNRDIVFLQRSSLDWEFDV
ncbi:non-ribosomal peptide synthetase [Paenibacillus sp. P32E]|uniref:non-ribosomal peptide synthetase n=1 Tax=Paenibacillus sp. P32E TaxID=1349434 RepID=UPI00093B7073|nr:non-ribosomal peptide synthetase [Paenibacillus sp. P32E]OKP94759.1 hypothetical protein A3848_01945 [Paenibacillus sp. P32E]